MPVVYKGVELLKKKVIPILKLLQLIQDNHDWFRLSSDKKTIYVGADNGKPGDFMRVIVAATPSNTAPVAADSSETVTENTYGKINTGSYTNVASASTDADGDTLTVTYLKYNKWNDTNSNGIINSGEIQEVTEAVNSGWNKFNTNMVRCGFTKW